MHEMALMEEIVKNINSDAVKRNFTSIKALELTVGTLSCAMPAALQLAFDVFCQRTDNLLTREAKLIINIEKGVAYCAICNATYEPERKISLCPNCEIPSGRLTKGETFKIDAYEGE